MEQTTRRITSVWIAIASATAVAVVCHLMAGEVGRAIIRRDQDLTLLSSLFYPDAWMVYLHPLPLGIWALFHTTGGREDAGKSLLLITTTLCVTLIFIVAFMFGLVMPHIPGTSTILP